MMDLFNFNVSFDILLLIAFAVWFIREAFQTGQFQWLWSSIILWLGIGIIGKQVLPGVLGVTQNSNLYFVPFCVFIGSIFYFINKTQNSSDAHEKSEQNSGSFILKLFAYSSLLMHLVWFGMLMMVIWQDDKSTYGATAIYAIPSLLSLYPLSPVKWLGVQIIIMAIWYIESKWINQSNEISARTLCQATLLIALLQISMSLPYFFHYWIYRLLKM